MADKRTRSKVQGGWARPGASSRGPQKSSAQTHQSNFTNSEMPASGFSFQSVVLPKEPIHRLINSSGDYVISSGPNGHSNLTIKTDFIESSECDWIFQQLHDEFQWHQHEVRKKGVSYLQPRMTAWIGDVPYSYSGVTHGRSTQWSPIMTMLKDTIESKTGRIYNSVLANLYRDGHDHVPWHCDDETEFGMYPSIASLSFGETRTFELRRKPFGEELTSIKDEPKDSDFLEYIQIPVKAGTLILMEGATQLDWQHRVLREYHDKKPRINLTFRFVNPGEKQ